MSITALIPLIFGLRGPQLLLVALLVLLLFGASRIPSMMRNLGKGVHSFKQGIEDAKAEMNKPVQKADEAAGAENGGRLDSPEPKAGPKDIDR